MSIPFAHLHVHTQYSLLDGASRIPALVARAKSLGQTAMDRLQAMLDTTDGFKIAERDLQMRGAGDLMGIRQAGEEREEGFLKDCPVSLLEAASVDAAEVYSLPTYENDQLIEAAQRRYRHMENIAFN